MSNVEPKSIDFLLTEDRVSEQKWKVAIRKLLRAKAGGDQYLENVDTLRDVANLSLERLGDCRGIGKETIEDLRTLQSAVMAARLHDTTTSDVGISADESQQPDDERRDGLGKPNLEPLIDYPGSTNAAQALLDRFFSLGERISLHTFRSRVANDMANLSASEVAHIHAVDSFIDEEIGEPRLIRECVLDLDPRQIFEVRWERTIESSDLPEYDQNLALSIDEYLDSLNLRNVTIVEGRLGLGSPTRTLESIGAELDVTKERIRQLEKRAKNSLLVFLREKELLTWELFRHSIRNPVASFPKTADAFYERDDFYDFLSLISGFDFTSTKRPNALPSSSLNNWMAINGHPIDLKEFINKHREQGDKTEKELAITELAIREADQYTVKDGFVFANKPPREYAAAAILLRFPKGLHFIDAANIINKEIYGQRVLRTDRLDRPFSDSEFIYTCEQGTYKHTRFIGIDGIDIQKVCENVLDALLNIEEEVMHLTEIYHDSPFLSQFKYFDVRYVTKWYGKTSGIFFFGKSRKDNVSLDPEAVAHGQAQTVERMLSNSDEPLSTTEIAEYLKSASVRHANLYLHELVENGRAISVAPRFYWKLEKALPGIPREALEDSFVKILEEKRRPTHIGVIAKELSEHFGKAIGPETAASLAKNMRYKGILFVKLPVCSIEEIPFENLTDLAEDILKIAPKTEGFIKEISSRLAISPDAAANLRDRSKRAKNIFEE